MSKPLISKSAFSWIIIIIVFIAVGGAAAITFIKNAFWDSIKEYKWILIITFLVAIGIALWIIFKDKPRQY